jgi:putative DNA primase/helicase
MPHFQHPASLRHPIGSDDATAAARILAEPEPTAADVAQLDQILAAAHHGDPAPPGALEAAVLKHGGRPVLMAVDFSYFLSGCGPQDIPKAIEDSGACEGTGYLGPPLMDDPVVPDPGEQNGTKGFTPWKPSSHGELSPMEQQWAKDAQLTPEQEARRAELYASAADYAQGGWRLVPLWHVDEAGQCYCPKAFDCPSPGKHPRITDWPEVATADPKWWRPVEPGQPMFDWFPLANIGAVQDAERTFTLDEDPDNGGDRTLEQLQERLGDDWDMPETLIRRTGSGGRHFEFLQPPGRPIGNLKLGKGLDVKGAGGYVVVPPSRTDKGSYSHILKNDPLPAPKWLLDTIGEHYKQQRGEPSRIAPQVVPTGKIRAYRTAAIERNKEKLASAGQGDRNNTLNDCAFALGQLAPAGITDEDECREVLYEAAAACGMSFLKDGVRGTFNSGWRSGMQQPWWPDWAEEDEEYPLRTWDEFGLADRLVDRFGETLRWAPIANRWMTWQSGRWEMDAKEAGEWMARPMIEAMSREEASRYSDENSDEEDGGESPRKKFVSWVKGCRRRSAMTAAAGVAKANALMRIDLNACDADPMDINCRNGVYHGETKGFTGHSPDQLLTMRADVVYDPEATCPRWDAFLERVQPDPEMRAYLYRIWGYSLTGDTSEQSLHLNYGSGANGKSVALDTVSRIAGDYGQVVPIETLLTSRNKQGRIPNDVARMKGRRFLKCSETSEGRRLDEALIKSMTGGESLVARFMRSEFFEFRPTGKIHLTSNSLVHISDDDATWRRVHLVPWLVTIPEEERNKYLARELYESEASGILNRLLAGLADWRSRGWLMPPRGVQDAVRDYREQEDTLGEAIAELYDIDMDHVECHRGCTHPARLASQLYSAYQRWCRTGGMEPMGRNRFYEKLEKRGFIRQVYQRARLFPQLQVTFESIAEQASH